MSAVLLDTHVVQWWSAEPDRLSSRAASAIAAADELAVAAITWYELGWLARHERIVVRIPIASWLAQIGEQVRTIALTPALAATAVGLPSAFPGDPADRLIYASAIEHGLPLITKYARLLDQPRSVAVW